MRPLLPLRYINEQPFTLLSFSAHFQQSNVVFSPGWPSLCIRHPRDVSDLVICAPRHVSQGVIACPRPMKHTLRLGCTPSCLPNNNLISILIPLGTLLAYPFFQDVRKCSPRPPLFRIIPFGGCVRSRETACTQPPFPF